MQVKWIERALQDRKGMSLIEVIAALSLLMIIVMYILGSFSSAVLWSRASRDNNQAANFAASLLDILQSHSWKLKQQLEISNPWIVYDEELDDDVFSFYILDECVSCPAPAGMQTQITAGFYDDTRFYNGLSDDGIPLISGEEGAEKIIFKDNLIALDIKVQPLNSSQEYKFSTVIGAR